jgi:hypothetical protein
MHGGTALTIDAPAILCRACGHAHRLADALDAAFTCWPQQRWIGFRCRECRRASYLRVGDGAASVGYLEGFPGPSFVIETTLPMDDLFVQLRDEGIQISTSGRAWRIPADPQTRRPVGAGG